MEILQYSIRKLIAGIPLVLGVTLISFLLIVYFGPDKTYDLLGKNPRGKSYGKSLSNVSKLVCEKRQIQWNPLWNG